MNATPPFIYLHGFNSSSQAAKAAELRAFLQSQGLPEPQVPQLSHWPAEAISSACNLIEASPQAPVLVGSSLGGFYATWLAAHYGLKAVLINPAVRVWRLMEDRLGIDIDNPYTGERYQLTAEHVTQLRDLYVASLPQPQQFLVLLQTGDETLDYREAAEYYQHCQLRIEEGGNHRFDGFLSHCPALLAFARS
ncbi:hypothetical protein WH50_14425 [Pokkaliibacter plantistimulans]|uniref:Esterase n=1 Tax=Pokkaliibacter plantistimulans TaxID=1635171 RepID=A0ABX5LZL0_9GAMM|nr:YqiA/YcfP family alpha/beta fold hydrolase [Pokkaliibacter plantistimulans]PXF30628.1 hypothetical protein WH50_14425 [Pokkaliibacter plantistimulans]